MRQFHVIQTDVGEWSRQNFGRQTVKNRFSAQNAEKPQWPAMMESVNLNELLPLLGIVEEVCETLVALLRNQPTRMEDVIDGIGDVGIYLCDYATRSNFWLPIGVHRPQEVPVDNINWGTDQEHVALIYWAGQLIHCELKSMQGIRGFDNPVKFQNRRAECCFFILHYLNEIARPFGMNILQIVNRVYLRVVKRDWNTNPTDADSVAESNPTDADSVAESKPNAEIPADYVPADNDGGFPVEMIGDSEIAAGSERQAQDEAEAFYDQHAPQSGAQSPADPETGTGTTPETD
jgi:hypothetical protein